MTHAATITKSGQIGIPKAMLEKIGLSKGDKIELVAMPQGRIMLIKKNNDLELGLTLKNKIAKLSIEEMEVALRNRETD